MKFLPKPESRTLTEMSHRLREIIRVQSPKLMQVNKARNVRV